MIVFKRICYLTGLIILFFQPVLKGQDVSVTAAFDTSRILIGDQIGFSIKVDQPSDLKLTLPFFRDSIIKNIEILSGPLIDTSSISTEKIRITEKYLVTSFDSGLYSIEPVYAEISDAGGIKRFYSDYSFLEVARVKIAPPDTASKIFDIAAPYRAPLTPGEILPWLLLGLLVSLIIWLVIRLINKLKITKKEKVVPVFTEPAHIIAFRDLEKLQSENLWKTGETKKYYIRLTEIIRQYLENRFSINSLEMTTSETLEAMVRSGFKKDASYNLLRSVLTGADLVKFAKYKPDPSENDSSFTNSWDFIAATKLEVAAGEKAAEKENQGGKEK